MLPAADIDALERARQHAPRKRELHSRTDPPFELPELA